MSTLRKSAKWVYLLEEGDATMRDLLGGKGAGLSEMTAAGLPVPPGFTITTEACNAYYSSHEQFPNGMWSQVLKALKTVEKQTGKKFGDPDNPLLVSVRSGAKVSMPGMMDSVLNLGLNRDTLQGLARRTGNQRFAYDAYRRFVQMFGRIVLGVSGEKFDKILEGYKNRVGAKADGDLSAEHLMKITDDFLAVVCEKTRRDFPQDPLEQLRLAIRAIFASWNGKRAIDYRNFYGIPHNLGTAANIVAMVFGNLGSDSGTGVAFTRDPATGEKVLFGEFLADAQGEDVVAGIRTPLKIAEMSAKWPDQYNQLVEIAQRLETHYRDAQDIEFTIEMGKLYMLQTRSAKRTAQSAIKIAVDMVNEGLISKIEALERVEPNQINLLLLPQFDDEAKQQATTAGKLLAKGLNASPGAGSGIVIFDADKAQELGERSEAVILVRPETSPDDVHGMLQAKGIITARGGASSHAAVVARGLGKPCVAGVESLIVEPESARCTLNGRIIFEGEELSIDGATGEIFSGLLPTIDSRFSEGSDLDILLQWADEVKRLGVWANADYPRDAQRALEYGAEGIGLCRTEHMFFEEERLPIVQRMILAAGEATRLEQDLSKAEAQALSTQIPVAQEHAAEIRARFKASQDVKTYHESLDALLDFQVMDFKGILRVMDGKPVIIRLLDPPLHEFLPRYEELLEEVLTSRLSGGEHGEMAEKERLLGMVQEMRETNPMLGLRGCRLGLMYSGINEMQARAIFTAACELTKEGFDPRPEIMVPLVGHPNELQIVREVIERVGDEVQKHHGVQVSYRIGTMIEVPRAALTATAIAKHADFFSFGTNDLTQTTFGYSRDDAEGKFLLQYVQRGILSENPFQVLDRDGVGSLIRMAADQGRKSNKDLEVGICGEHGGDPSSIEFCHQVGLDYVSASPFRVPVARLAAARAALAFQRDSSQFADV